MCAQQSEFTSQYVPPTERKGAPTTWGCKKVHFKGNTTYQGNFMPHQLAMQERGAGPRVKADGESNKLSAEMAAIQNEGHKTPEPAEPKNYVVTRRNRHAPSQERYTTPKDKATGVTVSQTSYKEFNKEVVMDSRKNRFREEDLKAQPLPVDVETDNKTTCTRSSYVNHGPIPKTKPVVPVKFAGDGRVFTTSKRTQYRDAYNDHQFVEVHRTKARDFAPTKAKFRDTTTSRACYVDRLAESQAINGERAKKHDKYQSVNLPLAKTTTYMSNYYRHDVQPRQREQRVTPTEAVIKIQFNGKSNTQMSYVPHPKKLYMF